MLPVIFQRTLKFSIGAKKVKEAVEIQVLPGRTNMLD